MSFNQQNTQIHPTTSLPPVSAPTTTSSTHTLNSSSSLNNPTLNSSTIHAQPSSTLHQRNPSTPASPASAKFREATNNANATIHNLADQAANHPIVQSGKEQAQFQLNALDRQLARFGFLNDLEARTNIPKTYGVIGFGAVFSLLILLNLFGLAQPITNLIGWALPAYLTIHALESPGKGDDAQWLCYWIVFGFLNYIESAALRVVLYYVPHYFTIKLFTTLWLMLPQFRGAEKVYYSALRPLFHQSKATASQLSSNLQSAQSKAQSNLHLNQNSATSGLNSNSGFNSNQVGTDSTGYSTGINTHVTPGSHNPFVSSSNPAGTGGLGGLDGLAPSHTHAPGGGVGVGIPPTAVPLPGDGSRAL